uniref:Uncharacterized protein LOC114325890 n=1 Tax=Diabrotica virgifera virgifera TaxID=50390 RepID=A0A6P7F386_DIAVI
MGASSSATRKLTVENDDPTSVIKVSEEVVDRLKGSQGKVMNLEEMSSGKLGRYAQNIPPCKDTERAVMECYKCNPHEPMKCARVVQAFQECVDLKRNCLLANRTIASN